MKQNYLGITVLATVAILSSCQQKETTMTLTYPETKKEVVRDTFFEQVVEDPIDGSKMIGQRRLPIG